MNQIIEDIKYSLFDVRDFDHNLEFVSWTGNGDSFVVKKDGQEYRVTISEESPESIYIMFDYMQATEKCPLTLSNLVKVFNRFKNDAGLIVNIENRKYFFQNMEDYFNGLLTCVEEGEATLAPTKVFFQMEKERRKDENKH